VDGGSEEDSVDVGAGSEASLSLASEDGAADGAEVGGGCDITVALSTCEFADCCVGAFDWGNMSLLMSCIGSFANSGVAARNSSSSTFPCCAGVAGGAENLIPLSGDHVLFLTGPCGISSVSMAGLDES